MTLRDYYAIEILKGLMLRWESPGYNDSDAILESRRLAGEMLAARRRGGEHG
jgi:hypothetical protein